MQDGCLEAAQLLLLVIQLQSNKTSRLHDTPCTSQAGIGPCIDACQRLEWPPMVLNRLALLATADPVAEGSSDGNATRQAGKVVSLLARRLPTASRCALSTPKSHISCTISRGCPSPAHCCWWCVRQCQLMASGVPPLLPAVAALPRANNQHVAYLTHCGVCMLPAVRSFAAIA